VPEPATQNKTIVQPPHQMNAVIIVLLYIELTDYQNTLQKDSKLIFICQIV